MGAVTSDAVVRSVIDQEAELIASAMRLVASGGATRAVVANLSLADAAMTIAARKASGLGVELESIWRPDEHGHDVIVRRVAPRSAA